MECFRIDWQPRLSFKEAASLPEAKRPGIYALYETSEWADEPFVSYIGKSLDLRSRMIQYQQGDSSHLQDISKTSVSLGIIYHYKNNIASPVTEERLKDVEKFFISEIKPKENKKDKDLGYQGVPVIVVNTGKRPYAKNGKIAKVMSHDTEFLKLLKDNLSSSDW